MTPWRSATARALELFPKNPEASAARNNLGALMLAKGETDKALAHFEAAMKDAPGNLESRFNAAIISLDKGRTERASSCWRPRNCSPITSR